ncbi:laccase lcc6 [Rhodocollybia butyracea]|uniref:laccase n=1 Tax=Rhodocollybia butyracea TaxID=206335 RepID=A0A9P5P7W8_9AGAR|nr:laccase lcc6 [Rhodocollybia butyracea]
MIPGLAFILLAPIGALAQSAGIGPVTDLTIVNAFLQPDGFNRSFVLANGVFPGPPIVGNLGDTFRINVIDSLTNGTMLLSTSIYPPALARDLPRDPYQDLYDVDDDTTIITLADWYDILMFRLTNSNGGFSGIVSARFIYTNKHFMISGLSDEPAGLIMGAAVSDATLINGLGRSATGSLTSPLAVISVVQGTRYRFRLVSTSCSPNFVFSIDRHTFSVIEADSVETEQVVADSIQIFAAQRYSFILNANQTVNNYWIRANSSRGPAGFASGINSAILRYRGAATEEPTTTDTAANLLQETSLHALVDPGAPGLPIIDGADYNLNLQLGFSAGNFLINGVQFIPPSVPVLLQIISGTTNAADLLPTGSVYNLPLNKTIQITFNASSIAAIGAPHPFHLHGHNFDVIRSANSTEYNFANPVRRDVVSTGFAQDNVTIRFNTNNAGPWFLHCHIEFHLEAGLAIVLAEGANQITEDPTPADWDELCPIYNNLTSTQRGGGGGPTS